MEHFFLPIILSNICQCGLHQESTESRKTLKQKLIFQIGTLILTVSTKASAFNKFILFFFLFMLPYTNQ